MKKLLLIFSIALAIIASATYYISGYSLVVLILLFASLVNTGACFYRKSEAPPPFFTKRDAFVIICLLVLCGPVYLSFLYKIPWQVGADEISLMMAEKAVAYQKNTDILGLSTYFGNPSLYFFVQGWMGWFLGGINLLHMRVVNALFGLGIMLLSYLLFRLGMPRMLAAGGALIVGFNHSLLGISRMALPTNSAVFVELAAFILLLFGLKSRSLFYTFGGGVVAGLTFYNYYPSRLTFVMWLFFLCLSMLIYREKNQIKTIVKFAAVGILGFVLMAAPMLLAAMRTPSDVLSYQQKQLLIYPQAREIQQKWVGARSINEGIKKNILNMLFVFNGKVVDHGWQYENEGHGFLDPLTGVLLLCGLALAILNIVRRSIEPGELLAVSGFFLSWTLFAFLISKAPTYTRIMILLSFIGYLSVNALRWTSDLLKVQLEKISLKFGSRASQAFFIIIILLIACWNIVIYSDFVKKGFAEGNDVGGTARYIEDRKDMANYTFYMAESDQYPYYSWGKTWHEFFVGENQKSKVLPPENVTQFIENPPFTIFTSKNAWALFENETRASYPQLNIHNVKPDGSLLAIEVK